MSNLKKMIRERMRNTGESYQTAHRVVTRVMTAPTCEHPGPHDWCIEMPLKDGGVRNWRVCTACHDKFRAACDADGVKTYDRPTEDQKRLS